MKQASIVRAKPSHAYRMKMREEDLHEVRLWAPGHDPYDALAMSMRLSGEAFAALEGAEVVAVGGYSLDAHMIHPWLICSDLIKAHRKQLMRHSRAFLAGLRRDFPGRLICNYVNRDNAPARAFIQSLGFVIIPTPGKADFDFFFLPHVS